MPLLSNMELMGIERGKEIGKEIGKLQKIHDDIKMVLQVRLGEITADIEVSLRQISDLSVLDEILKLAATANSLEEFKQSLGDI